MAGPDKLVEFVHDHPGTHFIQTGVAFDWEGDFESRIVADRLGVGDRRNSDHQRALRSSTRSRDDRTGTWIARALGATIALPTPKIATMHDKADLRRGNGHGPLVVEMIVLRINSSFRQSLQSLSGEFVSSKRAGRQAFQTHRVVKIRLGDQHLGHAHMMSYRHGRTVGRLTIAREKFGEFGRGRFEHFASLIRPEYTESPEFKRISVPPITKTT